MITLKMIKIRNKNRLLKSYTLKISERKLLYDYQKLMKFLLKSATIKV